MNIPLPKGRGFRPNRPGRTRRRLAERLCEVFPDYDWLPEDIWRQNPYYASYKRDCARWGAYGKHRELDVTQSVSSWCTMAECARRGVRVVERTRPGALVEVVPASRAASSPDVAAAHVRGIRRSTTGDANR